MNAPTITMPQDQAQKKLEEYRESLRRRADAEHEALVQAYEQLATGTPLISLEQAIREGGFDEKMRPRLAIARADRKQVQFTWRGWDTSALFDTRIRSNYGGSTLWRRVELGRQHGLKRKWGDGTTTSITVQGYALVPMIPADVRNRMKGQPRDHFILWEVEEWSDRPITAQPDIDPLLLKHLHGDLYTVLDQWDLTEIERLVMSGRREG